MTLDSLNAFTVTVAPQSVLWKYRKVFANRFTAVLLLWIICYFCLVLLCFHARLFVDALWSPAGKGLTTFNWYPGSGMVLDCIDSLSLHSILLWLCFRYRSCNSVWSWDDYSQEELSFLCICINV